MHYTSRGRRRLTDLKTLGDIAKGLEHEGACGISVGRVGCGIVEREVAG